MGREVGNERAGGMEIAREGRRERGSEEWMLGEALSMQRPGCDRQHRTAGLSSTRSKETQLCSRSSNVQSKRAARRRASFSSAWCRPVAREYRCIVANCFSIRGSRRWYASSLGVGHFLGKVSFRASHASPLAYSLFYPLLTPLLPGYFDLQKKGGNYRVSCRLHSSVPNHVPDLPAFARLTR